jgi:hypothetical protein
VLLDFDQKKSFNAKANASSMGEFAYLNNSSNKPPLNEKMTIYSFYMLHVDKFVKALDQSDKFCRVDKDPEEFATLLQRTAGQPGEDSIKCEDLLGPKRVATASTPTTKATISATTQTTDTTTSSLDDIRAQDEVAAPKSSNVSASESISDPVNIDTVSFSDSAAAASTPTTAATISASTLAADTTTSSSDDKSNFLSDTHKSGGAAVTSSTASSDASGTTTTSAFIPASGSSNSDHSSAPGAVQSTNASTAVSPSAADGATHPPSITASDANRDKTFSLLSYSFNLDPAIRNEVLLSGLHNYDRLHILMISFSATDWRGDGFCGVGFRAVYEGQQ